MYSVTESIKVSASNFNIFSIETMFTLLPLNKGFCVEVTTLFIGVKEGTEVLTKVETPVDSLPVESTNFAMYEPVSKGNTTLVL